MYTVQQPDLPKNIRKIKKEKKKVKLFKTFNYNKFFIRKFVDFLKKLNTSYLMKIYIINL